MNVIDSINSRGLAKGWHALRLAERAASEGKTMAEVFRKSIENASGFSVPAEAISLRGNKLTYRFSDGSTDVYLYEKKS